MQHDNLQNSVEQKRILLQHNKALSLVIPTKEGSELSQTRTVRLSGKRRIFSIMRTLIALLVLFVFGCKTAKEYKPVERLEDITLNLSPAEQSFTIDPAKDNLLKGDKGTRVFIPAGALVHTDGSEVKTDVTIQLKEFYSAGDMISAGLSSRSDSFLLQTGGMLHLAAWSGEKALRVSDAKSLVLAFPRKKITGSMEVFYGEANKEGMVNWMPGTTRGEVSELMDTMLTKDSSLYQEKIKVCGWSVSRTGDGSEGFIDWKLQHRDSTIWDYVDRNLVVPPAIQREFCETNPADWMNLIINKQGKVTGVDFGELYQKNSKSQLSAAARSFFTQFFTSLPPFDMRQMPNYSDEYSLSLCCSRVIDRERYAERFRNKYDKYRDQAIKEMKSTELELYIMNSTRLGWINCDRFYEDPSEKTDYVVELPANTKAKVQLIFPEISAVMQGEEQNGTMIFRNVPVGKKIKITGIAFGGKDQPMLATAETVVSKQPFLLQTFRAFSMKELDAEMGMQ